MDGNKRKNQRLMMFNIIMTIIVAILLTILLMLIANEYQKQIFTNIVLTQAATVFISVACSIIASLIWSRIDKEESQSINWGDIIQQVRLIEQIKFAPTKIYTGTNITHDEFNRELNKKIERTQRYSYMGDKAKFLAKRLDKDIIKTHDKLVIEVFLPDIEDDSLFFSRSEQLRRQDKHYNGKKREENDLIVDEKMDVIKSIYLLKNLEDRYDIKIFLHKEIPMCRFELIEDTLIVSLITALIDGNYYPITLVYEYSVDSPYLDCSGKVCDNRLYFYYKY